MLLQSLFFCITHTLYQLLLPPPLPQDLSSLYVAVILLKHGPNLHLPRAAGIHDSRVCSV
jgi:hypothetical protein